ncbi:MbtH family protein [Dyella acidiphila]|uniref:MbtH family NRPS accessory protein n=1 Tax=Dyella acidiphila TaxID=2775866 RepID=A0ABR9GDC2_9GAMM|nr:MbtH family NRPS accessory protein [Dyella acidiphila]MBE1162048.1 MbtH family NRPS accessory protein [Dyella acidiphila]
MHSNPFEATDGEFIALMNDEGQYSLWPTSIPVPAGWAAQTAPMSRENCLGYIEQHWTDMRPNSLVAAMS